MGLARNVLPGWFNEFDWGSKFNAFSGWSESSDRWDSKCEL